MSRKIAAIALASSAAVLAACASHYGGSNVANGGTFALPNMPDFAITATLPDGKTGTIMEELPTAGLGTVHDPYWRAFLSGFTQQRYSQALGFPPGTVLTIKNISSDVQHTFNVLRERSGPPAHFPCCPNLSKSRRGSEIKVGYASGVINPLLSVTVKAKKPGIYLVGCAFHYSRMHDVLVIEKGATPGPQATRPR